jgi:hypothetical protein
MDIRGNFIEQIPWEANNHSSGQEILCPYGTQDFLLNVYKPTTSPDIEVDGSSLHLGIRVPDPRSY